MLTDQQLAEIEARAKAVPRRVRQNAAAYASLLLERRDTVSSERKTMCADEAEHAFATMGRDVDSLAADASALLAELRRLRDERSDPLELGNMLTRFVQQHDYRPASADDADILVRATLVLHGEFVRRARGATLPTTPAPAVEAR